MADQIRRKNRIIPILSPVIFSLALVVIAATIRAALLPTLYGAPYIIFVPAVIISALAGGLLTGLLATACSSIAALASLDPAGQIQFDIPGRLPGIVTFVVTSIISVIICSRLRDSRKRLRQIEVDLNRAQEVAHTGSWRLDVNKNELTWSDENHRIFNIPKETPMTYETFLSRVHPDDREYVDKRWKAALAGEPYDIEHRIVVDGSLKWVREKAYLEFDKNGKLFGGFGTTQDVTDQKLAEEALRASYGRYRSFVEVTGQLGWITNAQGEVEEDMPAWREYTGQTYEEIKGWGWTRAIHPDDIERTKEIWSKAVKEKTKYEADYRIRRHDGVYRYFLARGVPVFKEDGSVREWVGTCIDITERKKAEDEIRRVCESLEQFSYVAAHDLQEPLRTMSSYSQLLEQRYKGKLDSDADDFINYIVEGAKRLQKLITDLLAYSRIGGPEPGMGETDCNSVLGKVIYSLSSAIEENGAVITHDALPISACNENYFFQLFQNLVSNAIKFRGKDFPRIHIGVSRHGYEWVFSVRDNGIGIDAKYKDRIFQIFQRLHGRDKYPGTGIGLSICKKIVEAHGGRIWVESELGKGSTFYFTMLVE